MKLALLPLTFVLTAVAQPSPAALCNIASTGVTGVTLNCTGLTPEQQQLLTSLPELLNKLLVSQAGSASEILTKLDACIAQGASRHVSQTQRDVIDAQVGPFKGGDVTVEIYSQIKETKDFGEEILAALKHAGLNANAKYLLDATPQVAFWVHIGANRYDLATPLLRALSQSGIANTAIPVDQRVPPDTLTLTVGVKP